ncbi:expressed unknown protein [Seminavis robusta]|uniref:G-protein coupled receptors family 3 profile domain-containing protein n=1 Tax=Seminavis robusta TaxID=568900 RepID=A0A9N8H5P4_9STRA|nr:expressed unknown protein [Seminavis robusta]|eukprot:Sro120_g058450.1 n/a (720) ;mRNA; r:45102-47508
MVAIRAVFGGLLPAALLPLPLVVAASVPFTLNGYDVDGGADPICWTLPLLNMSDFRFKASDFMMQPSCPEGTSFSLRPVDLNHSGEFDDNQIMYFETPYKFELDATVHFDHIAGSIAEPGRGNVAFEVGDYNDTSEDYTTLFFRLILCDTRHVGFCNPINVGFLDLNISDYAVIERDGWLGSRDTTENDLKAVQIGNHLFTAWIELKMQEISPRFFQVRHQFTIRLPKVSAGTFFVIGHSHIHLPVVAVEESLSNFSDVGVAAVAELSASPILALAHNETVWLEIGDAVPQNVIEALPVPLILGVSNAMKIGIGSVSGVFAFISLLLLGYIVHHRQHIVMKLAQWHFLCWLVACSIFVYVFMFTFLPTNDWHCRAGNFLEFVPLTMMAAILVGRTWRVYVTVSQAMSIGRRASKATEKKSMTFLKRYFVGLLTHIARFPYNMMKSEQKRAPAKGGFRQKATAMETTRLILWLSFPQFLMQLIGMIVYDEGLNTRVDASQSLGRVECDEGGQWIRRTGIALVSLAFGAAVALAWVCRDLPSAFNESHGVFQAATINTIVTLMAISLDQLATTAKTSPDVNAFLWAATSLMVASTANGCIVWPKVMRVQSGEEIIISNLLAQNKDSESSNPVTSRYGAGLPNPDEPNALKGSIHLGINDPVPKELEQDMLTTNELILEVRNELVEGRTPTLKEWKRLIAKVEDLHGDLDQLHFDWTEEDEQ